MVVIILFLIESEENKRCLPGSKNPKRTVSKGIIKCLDQITFW